MFERPPRLDIPRASLRTGRAQVSELIDAARVPVFLLDEHQVVRPGEIGTIADIHAAAEAAGLSALHIRLDGQFGVVAAGHTNSGCFVCWASSPAVPSLGKATRTSP